MQGNQKNAHRNPGLVTVHSVSTPCLNMQLTGTSKQRWLCAKGCTTGIVTFVRWHSHPPSVSAEGAKRISEYTLTSLSSELRLVSSVGLTPLGSSVHWGTEHPRCRVAPGPGRTSRKHPCVTWDKVLSIPCPCFLDSSFSKLWNLVQAYVYWVLTMCQAFLKCFLCQSS